MENKVVLSVVAGLVSIPAVVLAASDYPIKSAEMTKVRVTGGFWYEWATGRKVVGPCRDKPTTDALWGGGLYVRAGAVIPTWQEVSHCAKGWNEKVELLVWPHEGDGETRFSLYDDDGDGLGYLKGESARTEIVATTRGGKTSVTVGERRGSFSGAGKVEFAVREVKGGVDL